MGKSLLWISVFCFLFANCDSSRKAGNSNSGNKKKESVHYHNAPDQERIDSIKLAKTKSKLSGQYKTGDKFDFRLPNNVKVSMIWVEPGSFVMGSPEDEQERNIDREAQHKVTITKGFWLAETEFTQEQWGKVMGSNPSKNIGLDYPVEQVSFIDIQAFLRKINGSEGLFRLPTEAEWEFACRAGTSGPYAGDREEMTWHKSNSDVKSHPVAQKKPNDWGFYDMHGNILEKCSDWFQEDNTGESIDPKGPPSGEKIVERGGQFTGRVRHTRAADRQSNLPENSDFYVGFRLARSAN